MATKSFHKGLIDFLVWLFLFFTCNEHALLFTLPECPLGPNFQAFFSWYLKLDISFLLRCWDDILFCLCIYVHTHKKMRPLGAQVFLGTFQGLGYSFIHPNTGAFFLCHWSFLPAIIVLCWPHCTPFTSKILDFIYLCIILVSHHFDVNVHLQILAKSFQQFLVHVCKHFSMFMYHWQSTTHHSRTACSAVCWQAIPTAIFTAAPTTAAYKHWDQQPLTRQYPGEPSQPSTVTSSDQRWDAMMQKLQPMKALLQTQQQPIIQMQNNAVPLHPLCSPQYQTMYSRPPLHRVMSNPKLQGWVPVGGGLCRGTVVSKS